MIAEDGPGGDPDWANVQILGHFDSATNGGTSSVEFPNEAANGDPFIAAGSGTYADVSSVQSKFGGFSLLYPGSGSPSVVCNPGALQNFNVGTGDFTEEIQMWPSTTAVQQQIIDSIPGGNTAGYLIVTQATGILVFYGAGAVRISSPASTMVASTWNHVAVSRAAGVTRLFHNGTQVGSSYTDSNDYFPSAGQRVIGNYYNASDPALSSYFDEYRLTVGVGRYTSNFTPPAAAFPDF